MLRALQKSNKYQIFIVFGLTRPVLEHTIYCTQDEHANNYTTDAVQVIKRFGFMLFNRKK
jgi:hypothetical protein